MVKRVKKRLEANNFYLSILRSLKSTTNLTKIKEEIKQRIKEE